MGTKEITVPERYTDGSYLESNPTWDEEESPWKAGLVLDMLARNGLSPRSVCEVGCGAGGILAEMSARLGAGVEMVGYEVSPQAFELCRPKASPRLTFRLEDLLAAPAGDPYDVVMAIDVFEHVEDYIGFLRALRGRGRHKVFHIPLDVSCQTVARAAPFETLRREVGHLHFFTKETALATLAEAGYEVLDTAYTSKSMNLSRLARAARLVRKAPFRLAPDMTVRLLGGYSLLVLAT